MDFAGIANRAVKQGFDPVDRGKEKGNCGVSPVASATVLSAAAMFSAVTAEEALIAARREIARGRQNLSRPQFAERYGHNDG